MFTSFGSFGSNICIVVIGLPMIVVNAVVVVMVVSVVVEWTRQATLTWHQCLRRRSRGHDLRSGFEAHNRRSQGQCVSIWLITKMLTSEDLDALQLYHSF